VESILKAAEESLSRMDFAVALEFVGVRYQVDGFGGRGGVLS
jgi:hypothetical protein